MGNRDTDLAKSAIPLAKAIQDLRSELLQAVAEGGGKELRFKLEPIELELNLGMTYNGGANANVKFWVLEIGAKVDAESTTTHKLKLKLNPVDKNGNQFLVRDTVDKMPK